MIRILYFASLREQVGTGAEELPIDDSRSIADLLNRLRARGGVWAEVLASERTILAGGGLGLGADHPRRRQSGNGSARRPGWRR